MPVSSHTSRTAAAAIDSPGSTWPPGMHHTSKSSRRIRRMRPASSTATLTASTGTRRRLGRYAAAEIASTSGVYGSPWACATAS